MRGPVVLVGAIAVLSIAVATGGPGTAVAGDTAGSGLTLPTLPPLPSISLPPLPLPTPSISPPVPAPTPPSGTNPGAGGGGGTGGSGGSGGAGAGPGTTPTRPTAGGGGAPRKSGGPKAQRERQRPIGPLVAGRPGASVVVDDEATPAARRAGVAFLRADTRIADLARARDAMTRARTGAQQAATAYRALGGDIGAARATARSLHARHDSLQRAVVGDVRRSYQTGRPVADDRTLRQLRTAAAQADDEVARAELRVGQLEDAQTRSRAVFERYAASYGAARARIARIDAALASLARQRSAALDAVRAAGPAVRAQQRQTLAESGALGAQIRAASAQLRRSGRTVPGTGRFVRPSSGPVTSPYGMRYHPILHYTKLHTGTDFGVGDGYAHAADDGRVLFTVVSTAYGNFTVIDHGTIDGRHITTAYAHQARFLVRPGEVVRKGQVIGVIGATGYATGPHLHVEVRDDGAVEDPMRWLP